MTYVSNRAGDITKGDIGLIAYNKVFERRYVRRCSETIYNAEKP